MSQIFSESTNTLFRALLVGIPLIIFAVVFAWATIDNSYYISRNQQIVDQPIPFSHLHHVSGLGIDCRYCHTTVETQAVASIPSAETCMHCHTQIWKNSPLLQLVRDSYNEGKPIKWKRVYDLPDYVYFDHSIHISKGIGCFSCHSAIETMPMTRLSQPLTMKWCLDCHLHPEQSLVPRDQVTNFNYKPRPPSQESLGSQLMRQYSIKIKTDCITCHR
ncbi:MAG: cytochrome c3 family protein [Pseudobdellovibrionaceae bacterium]